MSEYKTGEQMAEEDENLQSLIRSAQKTVRSDLNAAYTLGVIAAVRWSSERIAAGGTVQEKGGGELEKCPECKGWKRWARQPDGSASEITCATCNGTGKATE